MTAGSRWPSASELQRLLCFAAASAAVHVLTLGVYEPSGAGRSASPQALQRTLYATLIAPTPGALPGSPEASPANVAPERAAPPDRAEPTVQRAGDPNAPRLPMPDKWYTASELDVRAEPLTAVEFAYPPMLERFVGRVEVTLFIDERGHVVKAQVLNAEPEKLFDEAALNGWRNVRFSPAMKGGAAVKSEKIVQVDFQPDLLR